MASDLEFVEYVLEQIKDAGAIRSRKMFGEYAIYCDDKVTALICDNRVFVKPTVAGRSFIGDVTEEPAYPGAKPSFQVGEQFENRAWFSELIRITAQELPPPKPKTRRKKAT